MDPISPFDLQLRTRLLYGVGTLERLGDLARELGFAHTLLVADGGIVALGLVERVEALLRTAGVRASRFHDFAANPDTIMVEAGRKVASAAGTDSMIAIGGGSSLDCAKGINFVLTNGGIMKDYHGHGKASRPMHPMIAVPTTAGTGSEAQQYALISDAETHVKMACGDPKACFKVAVLDPALTVSLPHEVTAIVGMDAISHAVESFVTTRRTTASDLFARRAWQLLSTSYPRVIAAPDDVQARGAMLLGAHLAGIAIEQSMLGATHACANPLTARFGTTHGVAIAVMLPHVVRWNGEAVDDRYADLMASTPSETGETAADTSVVSATEGLACRLESLRALGQMPASLGELGVTRQAVDELSVMAETQWTGTFNPRPFDRAGARSLYLRAGGW